MILPVDEEIWRYTPTKGTGERIAIVGGMHGDEVEGIRLLRGLTEPEHPFWSGCTQEVTLVLGHPAAIERGRREGPGGLDLNRAFTSQSDHSDRAAVIQRALTGVSVVLDIHQTHRAIEPCAVCPPTAAHLQLASRLGAVQAVTGAERLYGSKMLTDWVNAQGQMGLTLETGQSGDESAFLVAEKAVRRLLHPSEDFQPAQPLRVWRVLEPLLAPGPDYVFVRDFINGSLVREGELIATSGPKELRASADGAIFLPRLGQKSGHPCCVQVIADA